MTGTSTASAISEFAALIGLDRSDKHLDLCLQVGDARQLQHARIANTPEIHLRPCRSG